MDLSAALNEIKIPTPHSPFLHALKHAMPFPPPNGRKNILKEIEIGLRSHLKKVGKKRDQSRGSMYNLTTIKNAEEPLNEMSGQREEQQQPLLAEQEAGGTVHSLDIDERQSTVYRKNAIAGLSALTVQGFGITFLALIWGLVLASMPLKPLPLFGYHPMIQSLAFLLLLQSILTLQPTTKSRPNEKQKAFSVHRMFNLALVLPLFTVGASIMWYLHDQPDSQHFISWHGILGTAVIAWTWIQVAAGIAFTSFDGKLVGGMQRAKSLWKWHRISGYFLLPTFAFVLYLGAAQTSWSKMNANNTHHVAVIVSLIAIVAALFIRVQWSKLPSLSRS